uniref:Interleukin-6 receptor subunit beta-like n=1 Tax=Petromyzon marinus TaxID=7757 RepID=A0AAJ7X5H1_PETMA|nr:interleukin-6 receptor subunit beta-like [Petromyzon marinus]XP_032821796.1 interleukin-6 receptor subunit beta-like [Petromyzon marinus]XP_032821797.1 interleukin-6 receptor subunit beta-like [Petromyzon marinus]XP_032821798.1 interleukin-6 receptor subunit beta-like [Petromyzon marinus]XP_032821799.1 interleukin-6 receptor subunit beta-like [Petromyzon marinus]
MACSALLGLLLVLLAARRGAGQTPKSVLDSIYASTPCLQAAGSPGPLMCVLFSVSEDFMCHWLARLDSSAPTTYKLNWRAYHGSPSNDTTSPPLDVDPSWDANRLYYVQDDELLRMACDEKDGCVVCKLRKFHLNLGLNYMYEMWVTANGTAESQHLRFEPQNQILLPPPSDVGLTSERDEPTQLVVQWTNPFYINTKCQLRYRHQGTSHWTTVNDVMDNASHYTLYDLAPGSLYWAQLRCRIIPEGEYWSPWSQQRVGQTPDAVPLGVPDMWRELGEADARGWRDLTVLWKDLPEKQARGRVLHWLVSLHPGNRETRLEAQYRGATLAVPANAPVHVNVRAVNSAGRSNAAGLSVPALGQSGMLPPLQLSAHSQEGPDGRPALRVTWAAPACQHHMVKGYLVEWSPTTVSTSSSTSSDLPSLATPALSPALPPTLSSLPSLASPSSSVAAAAALTAPSPWRPLLTPSLTSWARLPANSLSFNITGSLEPCVGYAVSVYARYVRGEGPPARTIAFARECPPDRGPELGIQEVQGSSAQLSWQEIPLEKRRGVLRGYTIHYSDPSHLNKTVEVDASQSSVVLHHLQSSTVYTVWARARTAGGEGPDGSSISFKTKRLDDWKVIAMVAVVCVAVLLLALSTACLCTRCRNWIKEHLYYPDFRKSRVLRDLMQQQQSQGGHRQSSASDLETVVSSVEVVESESPQLLRGSCKGGGVTGAPTGADTRSLGGETSGIGSSRPSSPDRHTSDESDTCCSSNATSVANVDALLPPPPSSRRREGPRDGSGEEEEEEEEEGAASRSRSHQDLDGSGEGGRPFLAPGAACPRAHTWSCSDGEEPCLLPAPHSAHAEPYSQVSYRDRRQQQGCPGCSWREERGEGVGGDGGVASRSLDAAGDDDGGNDADDDGGNDGGFTDASVLLRSFVGKPPGPCVTDGECRCCGRSKLGGKSGGGGSGQEQDEASVGGADERVQAYFPQLVTEAGYMPQ